MDKDAPYKIAGKATYHDGLTAARHEIGISLTPWSLVLIGKGSAVISEWPYKDIRLAEEVTQGRPTRLKVMGQDARLTITDWSLAQTIFKHAKHLGGGARLKEA